MKRCNKKRGFTIVELVIVIAVIAILAAVLIPTFSGIIKKSKQSSDKSAVRNMNTILAGNKAEIDDISDAFDVLEANGISGKNYKALYSNRYFYFDTELKQVVYVNEQNKVLYPEDVDSKVANWVSLSGEIAKAEWKNVAIEGGVAKVDNANELYTVMKAIDGGNNKVDGVTTITLEAGEYDLRGADISIDNVKRSLTIGADSGVATIKGFVRNDAAREGVNGAKTTEREYNAGLIAAVTNANVTFKNIVIDKAIVGSADASLVGALVGAVNGNSSVTFDNVTISNTTVKGLQKVGAFVGIIAGSNTVTIKDCTTANVTVEATAGMAGGLFGMMTKTASVSVVKPNGGYDAETLANNVEVKLVKHANGDYRVVERTETNLLDKTVAIDMHSNLTICAEDRDSDDTVESYRYFASCSRYGFVQRTGSSQSKVYTDVIGYGGKKVSIAYDAIPAVLTGVSGNYLGLAA